MASLPLFMSAVASILFTPGPTNALLLASGALLGLRYSLPLVPVALAGYGIAIGVLSAFVRPATDMLPHFGFAVRVVLICYLLFLAWRLWHTQISFIERTETVVSGTRVFVTTLLNPKGLIFAFGIFPSIHGINDAVLYGAAFALVAAPISIGWIALGASARYYMAEKIKRLLPRLTALALTAFACGVALSAVSLPAVSLPMVLGR